jgi:hypothetical protein
VRRVVFGGLLVVVIILVAVGVHSCQVSQRNSALKDYNSNVFATIQKSNSNGQAFFAALTQGGGARSVYSSVNTAAATAASQLSQARGLSVPDQMQQAHRYLLLTLQMRHDALADVGQNIEQALGSTARKDAITAIAADMARLYSSDVVYKDYMLPLELGALRSAGIAIGGTSGQQVDSSQIMPSLSWLDPNFVASELHVSFSTSTTTTAKPAPGPHGHRLVSVSVAGTTLTSGGSATLTASPPPTFTLTFDNTGQNTEHNVVCKVTVSGTPVSGQTIVPQTTPGNQFTCNVPLTSAPPTGTYTVTAAIERVPGEVSITRNSQSFQITFK